MKISEIKKALLARGDISAWDTGVTFYAIEMLDELSERRQFRNESQELKASEAKDELLNGAITWSDYSDSGYSLISDFSIAMRLCTLSELKQTHYGDKPPNSHETWLNVQARALCQAYLRIKRYCLLNEITK